jgi:hypothetical protein
LVVTSYVLHAFLLDLSTTPYKSGKNSLSKLIKNYFNLICLIYTEVHKRCTSILRNFGISQFVEYLSIGISLDWTNIHV